MRGATEVSKGRRFPVLFRNERSVGCRGTVAPACVVHGCNCAWAASHAQDQGRAFERIVLHLPWFFHYSMQQEAAGALERHESGTYGRGREGGLCKFEYLVILDAVRTWVLQGPCA